MITKVQFLEFVETHTLKLVLLLSVLLVILFGVLIVSFVHSKKKITNENLDHTKAIRIENLFLPPNPLVLPEVLLYTEQSESWLEDYIKDYFMYPSDKQIQQFKDEAAIEFQSIMESVP